MIKSLYLRIVLTFIGVVLVSLIATFFISLYLFQTEALEMVQEDMTKVGKQVIRLFDTQSPKDVDSFFRNMSVLNDYWLVLYHEQGGKRFFAPYPTKDRPEIDQSVVSKVLQGGVYRSSLEGKVNFEKILVGMPLQIDGKRYALFVQPASGKQAQEAHYYLLIVLSTILGIGSLLILVSSRLLVRPLKQMTTATNRLATGDFDVRIKYRRKDELGTLANSFNHMAQELQQLEQMRQDFVSNVSHEIQSPLTSIRGFSKALQDGELSPEDQKRYLQIISDESERISRLSENLLRLASLESEHYPFHPIPCRLDESIRQAVIAAEPQWSAKELNIELLLHPVTLPVDVDQLSQVWTNLLANAIKYTPPGGTIRIELRLQENAVTVAFSDTGSGISAADLSKIFERFYKADKSRDRALGGNGLGLAIVKKIIAIHGGKISVKSQLEIGTTFEIDFPRI
ncbi:hypothetical protein CIG75_18550 [Tumebacillus algifaecis]|uniref:Heme sensor protein HssS n=1 Tax=Tumebacillus algifaecis TaxID=1214604 RepID=A0A223D5H0_9BACL|nr:ATP-binding protein [Tumebacillus algifaecis]ASS76740.1 hypothetical protein CIG75_18550 [Tumebacillus algifaecis]